MKLFKKHRAQYHQIESELLPDLTFDDQREPNRKVPRTKMTPELFRAIKNHLNRVHVDIEYQYAISRETLRKINHSRNFQDYRGTSKKEKK